MSFSRITKNFKILALPFINIQVFQNYSKSLSMRDKFRGRYIWYLIIPKDSSLTKVAKVHLKIINPLHVILSLLGSNLEDHRVNQQAKIYWTKFTATQGFGGMKIIIMVYYLKKGFNVIRYFQQLDCSDPEFQMHHLLRDAFSDHFLKSFFPAHHPLNFTI